MEEIRQRSAGLDAMGQLASYAPTTFLPWRNWLIVAALLTAVPLARFYIQPGVHGRHVRAMNTVLERAFGRIPAFQVTALGRAGGSECSNPRTISGRVPLTAEAQLHRGGPALPADARQLVPKLLRVTASPLEAPATGPQGMPLELHLRGGVRRHIWVVPLPRRLARRRVRRADEAALQPALSA